MTYAWNMLKVFILSLIPFVENKGALIFAAASKIKWYSAYAVTSVGSYCPVPILLSKFSKPHRHFNALEDKLNAHRRKYQHLFDKYGPWGLFLLTAIPFTGIGCWLGALLADTVDLPRKPSAIALLLGTAVSGLVTTMTVYGLVKGTSLLLT